MANSILSRNAFIMIRRTFLSSILSLIPACLLPKSVGAADVPIAKLDPKILRSLAEADRILEQLPSGGPARIAGVTIRSLGNGWWLIDQHRWLQWGGASSGDIVAVHCDLEEIMKTGQFVHALWMDHRFEVIEREIDGGRFSEIAIEEPDRWIPVSERLPDGHHDLHDGTWVSDYVLVCSDGSQYVTTGSVFHDGDNIRWVNNWRNGPIVVTHWQPLPAPPKSS